MFDVGTTGFIEPAAFTAMTADTVWGKSSVPTTSPDTGIKISMKLSELMDTSDGFYTYAGSLTTPTCNPVVTWVVLKKVLFIKGVCSYSYVCGGSCLCVYCVHNDWCHLDRNNYNKNLSNSEHNDPVPRHVSEDGRRQGVP